MWFEAIAIGITFVAAYLWVSRNKGIRVRLRMNQRLPRLVLMRITEDEHPVAHK